MKKMWSGLICRFKAAWRALVSRDTGVPLGYHKITCAVYYAQPKECNCGAGRGVQP